MTVVDTGASTRARLIDASIEVFREQGYERARVQDIARAAGLTTGAIYANYRDKAELLLAAIAAGSAAEVETLLDAGSPRSPRELLATLGTRMAFREHERPLLLDAVVASRRDPELAALLRDALAQRHARFGALIARGQNEDAIDPEIEVDTLTRFCITLALGSLVVRALDLEQPNPDSCQALIDRLLDAISPEEHPS